MCARTLIVSLIFSDLSSAELSICEQVCFDKEWNVLETLDDTEQDRRF